jgi:hypothetical protein
MSIRMTDKNAKLVADFAVMMAKKYDDVDLSCIISDCDFTWLDEVTAYAYDVYEAGRVDERSSLGYVILPVVQSDTDWCRVNAMSNGACNE